MKHNHAITKMEEHHAGILLLSILTAAASVQATDLCPFFGDWKYHDPTGTCIGLQKDRLLHRYGIQEPMNIIEKSGKNTLGHLVLILDKNTDDFVKDLMKQTRHIDGAFIGLIDRGRSGQYRWGDTGQKLGNYTGWAPGQPLRDKERGYDRAFVTITAEGWKNGDRHATHSVCQVDAVIPPPTISCPPGAHQMGQQSSDITCTVDVPTAQVRYSKLTFQRSGRVEASCTSLDCSAESRHKVSVRDGATSWSAPLQIKDIQRQDEASWRCSMTFANNQERTSNACDLKVYAVPSTVDCQVRYFEDAMSVVCMTSRMYPQAVCQWIINKMKLDSNSESTKQSTNNIQEDSDGVIFYKGECTASISGPVAGEYQFNVSVYPSAPGLNGTKPSTVKSGSLNVVVELPTDPPVLYTSGGVTSTTQLEASENQTVTINCQIKGGTPEVYTTVIKCYPQQQNESQGSAASITITTTRDFLDQNCSCYGRHLTGSTSETFVKIVSPSLSSSDQQLIAAVVSTVLGLVVVIVVVAVVWLVLVRRRRSKDIEQNMKVKNKDEAVYLNTLTSEAFKTGEETGQDNVYEKVATTDKPEDKRGIRDGYEASNYDCLASTAGDLNEDGTYTMITVTNVPATTPSSQADRLTDQSIYGNVN